MPIRALRGAITVPENTRPSLLAAAEELLQSLIEDNGIEPEAVVTATFTTTADLTAAYPAEAARSLGWTQAGLLCVEEMPVEGALEKCLRVLVLWESNRPQSTMKHQYLRGAEDLRPDLQ